MRVSERKQSFISELREGRHQIGLRSQLCSPIAAEALGRSGCDYVYIDMEHAPNDLMSVLAQCQAVDGTPAHALVRIPSFDAVLIQQLLDLGVENIVVPMIDTPEQARAAVAATRYPPNGVRSVARVHRGNSYGGEADYVARIESRLCLIVMVETRAALASIGAIAAVEGVHGVLIGPADLAADFGYPGVADHPDVVAAIEAALPKIKAEGAFAGMSAGSGRAGKSWFEKGAHFVSIAGDLQLMVNAARANVAEASE